MGPWCCGAVKAAVDTELAGSMLPNPSVPSVVSPTCVCVPVSAPCHVCMYVPADSASRSGFGKGFKPQVAPLSSLLGKLQARQAALEAR